MQAQVVFRDEEHKSFYNKKVMEYSKAGRVVDSYVKPLMYLLASNADTSYLVVSMHLTLSKQLS